jgi:hypothetical protein
MSSSALESLQVLYRALLRQAHKFPQYNYKHYAIRKIKEDFAEGRKLVDQPAELEAFFKREQESLEQLKRMVKVQSLFCHDLPKLVLETMKETKDTPPK